MNNLPKVVTQQRRGRASNPRLLDRKFDALPLSHRATLKCTSIALIFVVHAQRSGTDHTVLPAITPMPALTRKRSPDGASPD